MVKNHAAMETVPMEIVPAITTPSNFAVQMQFAQKDLKSAAKIPKPDVAILLPSECFWGDFMQEILVLEFFRKKKLFIFISSHDFSFKDLFCFNSPAQTVHMKNMTLKIQFINNKTQKKIFFLK